MLTQKRLKEVFHYNQTTGLFTRIETRRGCSVGSIAGHLNKNGYISIRIDFQLFLAHRLAWLYVYGKWPDGDIDHIDHNPANNKIKNLRDVTKSQNLQNLIKARIDSKTGILCVTQHRNGRYRVRLHIDGKYKHIGYYSTIKIAEGVALRAKRKHHSTCTI